MRPAVSRPTQGPFGAVGVTGMFAIGTTDAKSRPASVTESVTDLEGGVYWRARLGGLRLEARGGGGYLWLHGSRGVSIAATDTSAAFSSDSKSDRNGYEESARFGGSYQIDLGRFWVRPQAHVDYFHLNEGRLHGVRRRLGRGPVGGLAHPAP